MKNELAPPIMDPMLKRRSITYIFRNLQEFQSERKKTVFNGLETLSYRAPQLWTFLPEEIKICKECPCRLCKVFVPILGFI